MSYEPSVYEVRGTLQLSAVGLKVVDAMLKSFEQISSNIFMLTSQLHMFGGHVII